MAWTWRYEDATGRPVSGPNEAFSSQSDAESWLGQAWKELVEAGASTVLLCEDDRTEYRMELQPGVRE